MRGRSRRGAGAWLLPIALAVSPVPSMAQSLDGLAVLGPARSVASAQQGAKVRACAPGISALPNNFTHLRTPPGDTPRAVALGVCDVMIVPDGEADQASARLRALGVDIDGAGGAGNTSFAATGGAGALPGFVPGGRRMAGGPVQTAAIGDPPELAAPAGGLDPTAQDMPSRPAATRSIPAYATGRAPTAAPAVSSPRVLSAPRGADAPMRAAPVASGPRTLAPVRGLDPSERDRPTGSVGTAASRARVDEAQAWFSDGYDDLQRNRLESAASKFEQGLELSPYNWMGLFYLAQAYDRMGRVNEAIPVYDQVIEMSPRSTEATFARDRMRREGYTPRAESGSAARMMDEPTVRPRQTRRLSYEPVEPPERSIKEIFEGSEGASYYKDMQEKETRDKALPPLPQPLMRGRDVASDREGLAWAARRDRLANFDDGGTNRFVGNRNYVERSGRAPVIEREGDVRQLESRTDLRPTDLRPVETREPVITRAVESPMRGYAQPEPTRTRLQSVIDSAEGTGRVSTRLGAERPIRIVRTEAGAARPMIEEQPAPAYASPALPPRASDVSVWGEPQKPQRLAALPPAEPVAPARSAVETVPLVSEPAPPVPLAPAPIASMPPPAPMVAPGGMVPPVTEPPAPEPPTPIAAAPIPPAPLAPVPISPLQSMTLAFPDGSRYVGEVSSGKPDGQGALTYADGTKYSGGFVSGRRGGRGSLTMANGWRYEGDFVDDQPNGRGVLTQPDGTVYDGDFQAGRRTGTGTLTLANGEKYAGPVVDGVPQGRGVYSWPDGHRYEGDFRNGGIDGTGTMNYPGGRAVSGVWRNQELVRPL